MATKIRIDRHDAAGLIHARDSYDPKGARKAVWAVIRRDHDIPDGLRLKVEVDDTGSDDYLALKCADTSQYLWRVLGGGVVVSATNPDVGNDRAPTAGVSTGSRFASAGQQSADSVMAISVADLLEVLRGDEDADNCTFSPSTMPHGFPGVTEGGVVLDTADRILYFRD